jgi:hypothetical protein
MERRVHLVVGSFIFIIYSVIFLAIFSIPYSTMFWGFIITTIGSVIPDLIEPAFHCKHRKFFHSKAFLRYIGTFFLITTLFGLLTGFYYLYSNSTLFYYLFSYSYLISCFSLGYTVHLIADSTTKMGLPDY